MEIERLHKEGQADKAGVGEAEGDGDNARSDGGGDDASAMLDTWMFVCLLQTA